MKIISNNVRINTWVLRGAAAFLTVVLIVLGGSLLALANPEDESNLGSGQRIVTIFDNGERKSVVTKTNSVGDALRQAEIEIDAHDVVEPSLETKFDTTDYTVNVYRARPVLVEDGMHREWVMTPSLSAREIATEAELDSDVKTEDIVQFSDESDTVVHGISTVVKIDRATEIQVGLYGDNNTFHTQSATVAEFLKERDIVLGPDDTLSVDAESEIVSGMSFEIWRNGVQTITEEQEVDFPVRSVRDADKDVGFREVQTPGKKGKRSVTYEVIMKNGVEESRDEIQSVMVEEPSEEVVVVGVKPVHMPYTGGGSKSDWLAASSIPEDQWGYADWLVSKESGWNPNAVNRSSGACGLAQALPCSKVPGNPHDPVNSLSWMNSYVNGRYGSWSAAVQHSRVNGWY